MSNIEERLAGLEANSIQHQKTLENDIKPTLSDIWRKVNSFPCGIHAERMKGLSTRVNWLYFAFVIVILSGIVIGIWIK